MPRSSRSTLGSLATLTALCVAAWAGDARAQACCAGSGAVTPARLGLHEDLLAGVLLRAADHLGSHDADGRYVRTPGSAGEWDLEQQVFAAARVLPRAQVSALVPFVETYRRTSTRTETGGGIGDVNLSARYDLVLAHESLWVPGIGVLAGVTLPTGRSAEDAKQPLATDATGIGAVQGVGGLALEQAFGPWLVGMSGLVSIRAPRTVGQTRMSLAPQTTLLASVGHAFPSGAALALVLSYVAEGNAKVGGVEVPDSARRVSSASVAGTLPLGDQLRLGASVFANPPFSSFGRNQPVTAGATLNLIGVLLP